MKKRILSLVQILFGIAIIVFIISGMKDRSDLLSTLRMAADRWYWLATGFAGYLLCISLCSLRWSLLLQAQGMKFPFTRVLNLYFIGQFFSSFLPGATAGDLLKAYYVTRETPEKKTEAASSVFIDRLVGLIALILLAVVIMALRFRFFWGDPKMRIAMGFNLVLLLGTTVVLTIVFRRNLFESWSLFRRIEEKTGFGKIISRVYTSFRLCLKTRTLVVQTILLSLGNHITLVGCAMFLGMALGIDLSFWNYLAIFPVVNAVSAIPLTPNGLGTRDATAVYLMGVFSVPQSSALALSLLIYAIIMIWSGIGGLVYLYYVFITQKIPHAPPAAPEP